MKLEGFIGSSYTLAHPSAGSQRLVNLYPEIHEAGPRKGNVARFVGTPGLHKRAELGGGAIRGIHRANTGQLFVVSGASVYEVFSYWTAQQRSGSLGSSSGRVTMADDGTRVVIGDGGATAFQVPLASGSAVAAVADADCPGGHVAWQDGYFIHTVPGTGQFQISGLKSLDYDALDTAEVEGRPDLLVMVLSVNRQLWLFGESTTEVWWNSGNPDFPFERNQAAFIETGTISAGTCVRAGGSVAWVGSDERGRGTVWHARGFEPVRISTHAVEFALSGYSRLNEASAFAYQQGGHEFYQLSVPASGYDSGGTWVYDFATGLWHERSYLNPSGGEEPHRAWVGGVAFGEVVVGDREDGRLYTYDLDYYADDADPIRRLRQAPHVSQGEKRIRFNSFELQAEPGVGLSSGQGSAPIALLSWSDDGGHTWSSEHQASLGLQGEYKNRIRWRRLGVGRDRVFRVATSEPVPVTWLGAEIDAVQLGS
jgi:hypothetical protein